MRISFNAPSPLARDVNPGSVLCGSPGLSIPGRSLKTDVFQNRFGQGKTIPVSCSITEAMKSRWLLPDELELLFDDAPPTGLTLGIVPSEWGDPERAVTLLNAIANLPPEDLHASPLICDYRPQISCSGKLNQRGRNAILGFTVGNRQFALKVFTDTCVPLREYRSLRFFEGQETQNTMRVFACNAGNKLRLSSSTRPEQRPWMLSELITPDTVHQPGRGDKLLTDVAETFKIDLGDEDELDKVHGIVVDPGAMKSLDELVFLGNISTDEAQALIDKHLGLWRNFGV